jgi:hypothetical protein
MVSKQALTLKAWTNSFLTSSAVMLTRDPLLWKRSADEQLTSVANFGAGISCQRVDRVRPKVIFLKSRTCDQGANRWGMRGAGKHNVWILRRNIVIIRGMRGFKLCEPFITNINDPICRHIPDQSAILSARLPPRLQPRTGDGHSPNNRHSVHGRNASQWGPLAELPFPHLHSQPWNAGRPLSLRP